jgi:hypothetical protein
MLDSRLLSVSLVRIHARDRSKPSMPLKQNHFLRTSSTGDTSRAARSGIFRICKTAPWEMLMGADVYRTGINQRVRAGFNIVPSCVVVSCYFQWLTFLKLYVRYQTVRVKFGLWGFPATRLPRLEDSTAQSKYQSKTFWVVCRQI